MMRKNVLWLDRRIAHPGPYLCLCLTETAFIAVFNHLKRRPPEMFSNDYCDATAHYLLARGENLTAVVALRNFKKRTPTEIAGLLAHEAVHCWQEYCDHIGESSPGREQEAYAVQSIFQELHADYLRQTSRR